jgi:hypothetical protein
MPGKKTRRLLAMFLAIGSGCAFALSFTIGDDWSMAALDLIVGLLCVVGGLALRGRSTGAQIFARGAIWSSAVFQVLFIHLLSYGSPGGMSDSVLVITAGCVIAACLSLHFAGRPDHHSSSDFQPVAHLGTLTVALILAVADTLSLLFWGGLAAQGGAMDSAFGLIGFGALMGLGVYGLLRMRTRALLLNLVSNILIASVEALGIIDVGPLALVLITTAGLQLLVVMPILATILRPGLRAPAWVQAVAQRIPWASLLAVAALALQPLLSESVLVQVARWAGY